MCSSDHSRFLSLFSLTVHLCSLTVLVYRGVGFQYVFRCYYLMFFHQNVNNVFSVAVHFLKYYLSLSPYFVSAHSVFVHVCLFL